MSQSPSVSPRRTLNNKSSYIGNGSGLVLPPTQVKLNQQPILSFQQKATFDSNQQFFYYPESPTKSQRPRFNSVSQINKDANENYYVGGNNNGNRPSRYPNAGAANVNANPHLHHQSVSHINSKALKFNQTKEVDSIKDISFPSRTCTSKRYFTSPIDLHGIRNNSSNITPTLTNSPMKSKANFNIKKFILPRSVITTYKLASPVHETIDDISKKIIILQISLNFEKSYHFLQPIQLSTDKKTRISKSLDELCGGHLVLLPKQQNQPQNNIKSVKNLPNINTKQRTSTSLGTNANESFELSFDGKAMDRSDIFRMVDSFSIAISDEDEDDDEDNFQQRNKNNRILPAEILSNGPLK